MDSNPGPIDGCVLYDQDKHVSSAVWDGQERGALRCHEHTSKLGEWKLNPRQIELVEKAGFGYLRKIPAISLDNPLISALVERWRRETNTFHLIVGEMTVTLQDVALLLGLAIDGKPVIGITHTTCTSVCMRLLGKAPDSNYASGGMVKLSWLKEFFSQCPEDAPNKEVERCTRAYLLYLVGSTIFSTTTGNKVPVMYLPLFENFEEAGNHAWGAAALAFLYRALGNACVKSQSTICGCLTLLQCWSYFHLNIGRPKLNRDPIHDHFPFVLRWKGKQSGPTTNRDVVFYRKALDSLKASDVEWLPYKYIDSTLIPEEIRSTLILGRSKTMLICFDKAERHLADRCRRQYGMSQPVPEDVVRWVRKSRGVDGGVDLSGKMESELTEWFERRLHIVEGDDTADESEYIEWYSKITCKVVGRPISLSSEFQRTISGLREIAYLADSFSTKGLDGQQFESISRIRIIAQDCLRDQVGSPAMPSPTPQIEIGKRSRGKEKVRRKGSGKRRRKDDPMDYHEASEDDQSQFFGAVIEVDQLELHQADGEVGQLQLSQADNDGFDSHHLSPAAGVVVTADDVYMIDKVDDVQLSIADNEIIDTQPCEATNKINDSQACEPINDSNVPNVVKDLEIHDTTSREDDSQPCLTNEVDDSQLRQATTNSVSVSQLQNAANKVNDSQLCDAKTKEVHDLRLPDAVKQEILSQNAHTTTSGSDLLHADATTKANDSKVADAPKVVNESVHSDSTKEASDSQLLDAYWGENDSQLPEAPKNATKPSHPDATKEANDSQLSDVHENENESSCRDGNKEANYSHLPDAPKEANELPCTDTIKETNDSQFPDASKEADKSAHPKATKEANDSQLRDASEEENKSALTNATEEENVSWRPDAPKEANKSAYPNETKKA